MNALQEDEAFGASKIARVEAGNVGRRLRRHQIVNVPTNVGLALGIREHAETPHHVGGFASPVDPHLLARPGGNVVAAHVPARVAITAARLLHHAIFGRPGAICGVEGGYRGLQGVVFVYIALLESLVRFCGPDESVTQGHAQDQRY